MYAVIESGGKQYRVSTGDVIDVERDLVGAEQHQTVSFERVLMVSGDDGVRVGTPLVDGAKVTGALVGEVRGPKLLVFKKKRRKGYKSLRGHRQDMLRVRIDKIEA